MADSQLGNHPPANAAAHANLARMLGDIVTVLRDADPADVTKPRVSAARPATDLPPRNTTGPLLLHGDGVLPTQGAANPALTIMALAARAADHLVLGS